MYTDDRHAESLLRNVVHDLRQPLSILQASAFHLDTVLGERDSKTSLLIEIIQRQVEQAAAILKDASTALQERRAAHCLESGGSVDLTNETTAAVR